MTPARIYSNSHLSLSIIPRVWLVGSLIKKERRTRRFQNHNFSRKNHRFPPQIDGFLRFFVVLMLQIEFRYDFKQFLIDFVAQNALKSILKFLILWREIRVGSSKSNTAVRYLTGFRADFRNQFKRKTDTLQYWIALFHDYNNSNNFPCYLFEFEY